MKKYFKNCFVILFVFVCHESLYGQYSWKQMSDFGGGVRDIAFGFSIGNYGYAGTGRNPADCTDFWQYDPANNTWTQKASYPGLGKYGLVSFSIGNFGYAGTGWSGSGGGGFQYNDFWQYDPVLNSWTQKNNFGGTPRYSAVGFAIGNKGYIGLGNSPMLNDFWEYDPIADSWNQKNNFPYQRQAAVGFGIGSKGYVGTGYDNTSTSYNDFHEFDPVNNSWTAKSNVPGLLRRGAAAFVIGNYGYVGMGYNDTTFLTDFYQFDPLTNSWITVASIGGIPRYAGFSFSVGNYGYVGTGSYIGIATPIRTSDFWQFGDCDGTGVGINVQPPSNNNISVTVTSDSRKGLILDYNLSGERDVVFNLYNSLGQSMLSLDLLTNSQRMYVSVLLSNEIYFYSFNNHNRILNSGKVLVY